ncbi:CIC11C00000003095 [Sungouiella intermedia]|uniref:triacylglycerol lipase n=1 Tax=Sungouiella intermedia TaxID=45354 RepID=A0A1L0CSH6_9ASCO|nr:CIC11C00000003095 [[Candida] intermedia]
MWVLRYLSLTAMVSALPIDSYTNNSINTTNVTMTQLAKSQGSSDFFELKKYANLASVAYCLNKGLRESMKIGDQEKTCPSLACSHEGISHYKVLKTFRFDGWFDVGSSFISVDHHERTLYLTFRGTSSTQDWLNNFDAFLVDYTPLVFTNGMSAKELRCEECKIHRGFNSFVTQNGVKVVKEMTKMKKKYPNYQIVVSGHSLGGAMALLAGIELRILGYDTLVVTLAGPMVGNQAFADFTNKLLQTDKVVTYISKKRSFEFLDVGYVRMIHKHDIVPLLPPSKIYQHAGYEYYLSNRGVLQTPESVIRRGTNYVEDVEMSYQDMIPSGFSRDDHVNYFFLVTSCVPPEDA